MTKPMRIKDDERRRIYVRAEEKLERKTKKAHCAHGKKVAYSTKKKALKALGKARAKALKEHKAAVRTVYRCPNCEMWHLTKKLQSKDWVEDKDAR